MYKIIGADGRMYGPVTPEQLRQWMVEGRANSRTLTQPAGSTDWKPLAEFPEFSPTPPIQPPPRIVPVPRTNGLAITSLVLGIAGYCCCCCGTVLWIAGIIFACIAFSQIKHSAGQQAGKGLAVIGLVLCVAGLFAGLVWMLFCFATTGHCAHFHYRPWDWSWSN